MISFVLSFILDYDFPEVKSAKLSNTQWIPLPSIYKNIWNMNCEKMKMQCSTYIHISSICRFFFISEVYSLYVAMFHNNNNKKKWNKLKWAFNTSYLHLCLNQNLTRQNTQSMNCPTLLPWKKKEKIESKVGFTPGIFLKIEKKVSF